VSVGKGQGAKAIGGLEVKLPEARDLGANPPEVRGLEVKSQPPDIRVFKGKTPSSG